MTGRTRRRGPRSERLAAGAHGGTGKRLEDPERGRNGARVYASVDAGTSAAGAAKSGSQTSEEPAPRRPGTGRPRAPGARGVRTRRQPRLAGRPGLCAAVLPARASVRAAAPRQAPLQPFREPGAEDVYLGGNRGISGCATLSLAPFPRLRTTHFLNGTTKSVGNTGSQACHPVCK